MKKRVHEIAKERGVPAKEVLEKLQAAGLEVKVASSSVDEAAALAVLGNGERGPDAPPPQAATPASAPTGDDGAAPAPAAPSADTGAHKRPTRDSLQGERAPGAAGGRRRVVIDSQA